MGIRLFIRPNLQCLDRRLRAASRPRYGVPRTRESAARRLRRRRADRAENRLRDVETEQRVDILLFGDRHRLLRLHDFEVAFATPAPKRSRACASVPARPAPASVVATCSPRRSPADRKTRGAHVVIDLAERMSAASARRSRRSASACAIRPQCAAAFKDGNDDRAQQRVGRDRVVRPEAERAGSPRSRGPRGAAR